MLGKDGGRSAIIIVQELGQGSIDGAAIIVQRRVPAPDFYKVWILDQQRGPQRERDFPT